MLRFVCLSCVLLLQLNALEVRADRPPNILLFYADDLGWMDLGIQGSPYYETPNIDAIGRSGIRFTNAYSNAANCAPSRACLMTGLYTPRHGVYTVGNSDRGDETKRRLIPTTNRTVLDTSFFTLPEFLKEQGYRTCIAGKWHLSEDPMDYHFDVNYGGCIQGHPKAYFSPYHNPALTDGPEGEHLTGRLAEDVSAFIRRNHRDPFFVYLPFYAVHTPIQARPDLEAKYKDKEKGTYHNKPAYAAMIEAIDLAVGRVMDQISALGLEEETIVVFTSDNGAHGGQTLSRPLRGSKGMYYEGGIRVPLLFKWPGHIKAGMVSHAPVIGTDLFPTMAEMVAPESMLLDQVDGRNIWPIIRGDNQVLDRALFWHFPAYLQSYQGDRAGDDAHDKPHFRTSPCSVVRMGDWKLIRYYERGDEELYDLSSDLGEQHNLIGRGSAEEGVLVNKLDAWLSHTKAPIPRMPNPAYAE